MLVICYGCLGEDGVVGVGDLLRMLGRRGGCGVGESVTDAWKKTGLLVLVICYGCLREEGVVGVDDLLHTIFDQENIPEEWRDSVIIPILKREGGHPGLWEL